MKVGDKVRRTLKIYDAAGCQTVKTEVEAEIIFIHPERRFYTLECKLPGGYKIRETEYFFPRCGMERY